MASLTVHHGIPIHKSTLPISQSPTPVPTFARHANTTSQHFFWLKSGHPEPCVPCIPICGAYIHESFDTPAYFAGFLRRSLRWRDFRLHALRQQRTQCSRHWQEYHSCTGGSRATNTQQHGWHPTGAGHYICRRSRSRRFSACGHIAENHLS